LYLTENTVWKKLRYFNVCVAAHRVTKRLSNVHMPVTNTMQHIDA
jgi:hypothetical protein